MTTYCDDVHYKEHQSSLTIPSLTDYTTQASTGRYWLGLTTPICYQQRSYDAIAAPPWSRSYMAKNISCKISEVFKRRLLSTGYLSYFKGLTTFINWVIYNVTASAAP